jgi:putative DNA primase/helicase
LHKTVSQALEILGPLLFVQGSTLVRVGEAIEVDDDVKRAQDQQVLIGVTPEYIQLKLTELARIEKFNRMSGWVAIDCPRSLAGTIVGQKSWPHLRQLNGIVRAPFIRTDGSICDEPGYDRRSRAFYIPNATFPALPEEVSRDEARAAMDTLLGPFDEFPYATPATRSAFAAHILTEAARLAIDRVPIFWYSAQYAGTGKSLLAEMPARIVHGNEPALRPWVQDDTEMRKTLFASLLAGDRSIGFDNLPTGHKVRSATLCAFVTASTLQDRKLGVSEAPSVNNCAVVSASGNNITPASDLARRSLVIRLDADMMAAELRARTFRISNLRRYVSEHRVELLMAALAVIRGHRQSGHVGLTELPSFETWSRVVRDALLWLDMADPVETQRGETEDDSDTLMEAFGRLGRIFVGTEFTAQDLAKICEFGNENLVVALQNAGCEEPRSPRKIGYWLRDSRDKIAGGYKLEHDPSTSKAVAVRWRLRPVDEKARLRANDEGFRETMAEYRRADARNLDLIS